MQTVEQFLKNVISEIETKLGVLTTELKTVIIPDGISLGTVLLKIANSAIGEIVLSGVIAPALLATFEKYITEGLAALTTAENIVSLPTEAEQLAAFATWLQTLTADSRNALVIKLVQILVKLADGNKLAGNVYDILVQTAVTDQKLLLA